MDGIRMLCLVALFPFSISHAAVFESESRRAHCPEPGVTSVLSGEHAANDALVLLRAEVVHAGQLVTTDTLRCRMSDQALTCPGLGRSAVDETADTGDSEAHAVDLTGFDQVDVVRACTDASVEVDEGSIQAAHKSWGIWWESENDDEDCNDYCQSRGFASGTCEGVNDYSSFIGAGLGVLLHCLCVTPAGNEHEVDMADPDPGRP
jgi:hypothetical protein